MDSYQSKLGNLADKLKQEKPQVPVQEVHPVRSEIAAKVPEVQFNNWIPKALLKRLKAHGLEFELSLKDINIQALELYLRRNTDPEKITGKGA